MKLLKILFLLKTSLIASTFGTTFQFTNPISSIIDNAQQFIGVPYKFGANSLKAMDCSSFVQRVFHNFGVRLPRTALEQSKLGSQVPVDGLKIGDLLFFETYKKGPSHVAIYAGNNIMIHSTSVGKKVQMENFNKAYYQKHFLFAKRLNNTPELALLDATEIFPSF